MEDAGLTDEVPGVAGQEIALARDHRRRDGALVAADDGVDAQRETIARPIDRGGEALAPGGIARRGQHADRPERRAHGADALKIGVAREIVAAGQRRVRRRQQSRLQGDIVAGGDVGRFARRHAHAARREIGRHVAGVRDREHQPCALRPQIDLLDIALQLDDPDMVEHRGGDARRAQPHRQEPRRERRRGEPNPEGERPCARKPGERGARRGQGRRQPQHGLAVSG